MPFDKRIRISAIGRQADKLAIVFVLVIAAHPLQQLLGMDIKLVFALSTGFLVIYAVTKNGITINRFALTGATSLLLLSLVASAASGINHQLWIGLTVSVILLIAFAVYPLFSDERNLNFLISINAIILVGAWVGFFYAFSGGTAFLEVTNPGGQPNYFYLTTFTNSVVSNYIRPSGFFNEPGALAMFTILVVLLNELQNGNKRFSALLISLNLITFSVMALVAFALLIIYQYGPKFVFKNFWFVTFLAIGAATAIKYSGDAVPLHYLQRFEIRDGTIVGDNRTRQVKEFFSLVDSDITRSGAVAFGHKYQENDQSSNPFSIFYSSGLIMWIPYLLLELWLLSLVFSREKRLRLPSLLLALLLLQRPYVYSMYWGLLIWIVVVTIYVMNRRLMRHS